MCTSSNSWHFLEPRSAQCYQIVRKEVGFVNYVDEGSRIGVIFAKLQGFYESDGKVAIFQRRRRIVSQIEISQNCCAAMLLEKSLEKRRICVASMEARGKLLVRCRPHRS